MKNKPKSHRDEKGKGPVGLHHIWDFYGVDPEKLQDRDLLEKLVEEAVDTARLNTLREPVFHKFSDGGEGVTGFVLLCESHLSLHSFPEKEYLAVELFSCGDSSPPKAIEVFRSGLSPEEVCSITVPRGSDPFSS